MPSDSPAADAPLFHAVFSLSLDPAYPDDPLSVMREHVGFTVHGTRDAAVTRLLAELDTNLEPMSAAVLRRSFLIEAAPPATALASGVPHRWIGDRVTVLLTRAGIDPRRYLMATARGLLTGLLLDDLKAAITALVQVLPDAGANRTGTAALAMEVAGSAARSGYHGAIGELKASRIISLAQEVGSAAWNGGDGLERHLPSLVNEIETQTPVGWHDLKAAVIQASEGFET